MDKILNDIMMNQQIRFSFHLPYYAQIASPGLAEQIFSEKMDPIHDPAWASTGASTPEEYSYWVMRACGIVCVKMCAEGFGRPKRSVHEWIKMGLEQKAYLVLEENGKIEERGWIHKGMADLLNTEGLVSQAIAADQFEIVRFLKENKLFIASVSYQIGTEFPVTFKGGHLVVVHGVDLEGGYPVRVYVHNPSGRKPCLQENAAITMERFMQAYTGRGVVVGLS